MNIHSPYTLTAVYPEFANDSTSGNGREEPLRLSFIHQTHSTKLFRVQPSHEDGTSESVTLTFFLSNIGSVIAQSKGVASADERSFFEVRFQLAFTGLHCTFIEGGLSILPLIICYGCHVLQKALDCEKDIRVRLLIVSELLLGDPAQSLAHLARLEQGTSFNCRATRSSVFTAALIDYGIVLDSARTSDFHLVRSNLFTVFYI